MSSYSVGRFTVVDSPTRESDMVLRFSTGPRADESKARSGQPSTTLHDDRRPGGVVAAKKTHRSDLAEPFRASVSRSMDGIRMVFTPMSMRLRDALIGPLGILAAEREYRSPFSQDAQMMPEDKRRRQIARIAAARRELETAERTWASPLSPDAEKPSMAFARAMSGRVESVHVVGDLHGNRKALKRILDAWGRRGVIDRQQMVVADGHMIVFTGDLIDRGPDSLGVVTEVFRLLNLNPARVVLVSGNHEASDYGEFGKELAAKRMGEYKERFFRAFRCLPSSLALDWVDGAAAAGSARRVYFAHGGFPKKRDLPAAPRFPDGSLTEPVRVRVDVHAKNDMEMTDLSCNPSRKNNTAPQPTERNTMQFMRGTLGYMDRNRIDMFVRGHQHNDAMDCDMWTGMSEDHGLVALWDETGDRLRGQQMASGSVLPETARVLTSCASASVLDLPDIACLELKDLGRAVTHHWSDDSGGSWNRTVLDVFRK